MSTRQWKWASRKIAEGKCGLCGKKRTHYATTCDECQIRRRRLERKRIGGGKYQKGITQGRPPLVPE